MLMIIFVLAALAAAVPTAAKNARVNLKGEVISITAGSSFQIETKKSVLETIIIPEGNAFPEIEEGCRVIVRGERQEDGTILAESVKVLPNPDGGEEEEEGEGGKSESAFCDPEKEKGSHPVAAGLAEVYEVDEEEIMGYFCDGFGFGQIMLALQTDVENYGELLSQREEGLGWGEIWQELGLIGKPEDADAPPGHLKRPDHAGGPPDHAGGPPDHAGGPPDHAGGPPDHAGNPNP
jgi:hypothetical protein